MQQPPLNFFYNILNLDFVLFSDINEHNLCFLILIYWQKAEA